MPGPKPGTKRQTAKPRTTQHAPYPTEFKDLSPAQIERLDRLMLFCRRRIADALLELRAAKVKHSYKVEGFFRIPPGDPKAVRDITHICQVFNRIVGVLLGHEKLRFDGEPIGLILGFISLFGHRPYAMVHSLTPPKLGAAGEVEIIRKRFFAEPWDSQARAIIHEVGHRFCGLEDKKYLHGRVQPISRADALINADTYASFAIPIPAEQIRKQTLDPGVWAPTLPPPPIRR